MSCLSVPPRCPLLTPQSAFSKCSRVISGAISSLKLAKSSPNSPPRTSPHLKAGFPSTLPLLVTAVPQVKVISEGLFVPASPGAESLSQEPQYVAPVDGTVPGAWKANIVSGVVVIPGFIAFVR